MPITIDDLIFTKRTSDNIDDVYNILVTCGIWMKDKYNLIHWYPPYAKEVMQDHAKKYEVYSVEIPSHILQQYMKKSNTIEQTNVSLPDNSSQLSSTSSTKSISSSEIPSTNTTTLSSPTSQSLPSSLSDDINMSSNKNILVGTFTIGTETWVPYFRNDMWTDPNAKALYLGKLAILPIYQGLGLAKLMLKKLDYYGKEKLCQYIRFDAIVRMPVLEPLYTSCGFQIIGRTAAPDASGTINELFLFEKKL